LRRFTGIVSSAEKCVRQRSVIVHKDRPGRDPVVGEDKTTREGQYVVKVAKDAKVNGRYYAEVLRSVAGTYGKLVECGDAESKLIKVRDE